MSVESAQLAQAAEDAVLAARRARAAGDADAAAGFAGVAIQRFLACADVWDDRRPDDANDLARAAAAAAQATDFLGPRERGLRPLTPVAARGAWRQPGRALSVPRSDLDSARAQLDGAMARLSALGPGRPTTSAGRRSGFLASTSGGFRR